MPRPKSPKPKFGGESSYGDFIVYMGDIKYTYHIESPFLRQKYSKLLNSKRPNKVWAFLKKYDFVKETVKLHPLYK